MLLPLCLFTLLLACGSGVFSRLSLLPTLHKKPVRNEARFEKMLQKHLSERVNATVLLLPVDAGYTAQTEKKQAQAQQEQCRREREDTKRTRRKG